MPHRRLSVHASGLATLAFAALATGAAGAQGLGLFNRPTDGAPAATLAVPDPAALKPGWWDYLATDQPGLGERIGALMDQAAAGAAQVPPEDAEAARQALQRLRISLAALPGMLGARPAELPPLPAPQATYTTTATLDIDRGLRDLQADLDERRSAINVAERAIRDGERQSDAAFASYLASAPESPDRILAGLRLMATRAEVAVTRAEVKLRQAEAELLQSRIREMTGLRTEAAGRIVPDPERPPEKIRSLVAKDSARLEEQRSVILRTRAERSELASRVDTTKAGVSLADLRILAAMIEENVLAARIELYETELDWLRIAAGDLDAATVREIDERLEQRRSALDGMDQDTAEWVTEIQRLVSTSLRMRGGEAANGDQRTADEMIELGRKTITRLNRLRALQADARFAISVTTEQLATAAGWGGWLRALIFKRGGALLQQTDELLGAGLFRIGDAPVTAYGLLRVLLIMAAAVVVSRVARRLLMRFGSRQKGSASAGLYTVGRLLHYVLITAALIIGLSSIGLDFSQLALVAGALSIGIGFGLQSVVNNFVSGLMILFEQSLKVGDVVELDSGVRGSVREISVRSTLITTSDGVDIIVPNSEFVAGKVINFTLREPFHRIHVPFGVAYTSDKDKVREIVIGAARAVPFTHERPGREPDVWLVRFGDNSLDFELVVWINPAAVTRAGAVMATYLWEIESALKRNGVEIPFPQRDIHLRVSEPELAALGPAVRREPPPA